MVTSVLEIVSVLVGLVYILRELLRDNDDDG